MDLSHHFGRSSEWRAARADEAEFLDIARALRTIAGEVGEDPGRVIDSLTNGGLPAALGVLAQQAGTGVERRFWQERRKA